MMTSTFAHPSVSKHEDDIVLANFLTNKLILDQPQEFWNLQQPYNNYYYHSPPLQKPQSRPKKSSNEQQVHKSINSTRSRKSQITGRAPINRNNCNSSATKMKTTHIIPNNNAESKRRSKPVFSNSSSISDMENIPVRRPPSVSSVASSSRVSIQSEMSINTKISLSKKLLNVFSMGSRSSKDLTPFQHNNDSQSSLASQTPSLSSVSTASSKKDRSTSFRRRSFASISNLFNKSSPSLPDTAPKQTKSENERRYSSGDLRQLAINKNEKNKPDLQVDTNRKNDQKNGSFHYSSAGGAPDSPNSVTSSRSSNNSRLPQQRFMHPGTDGLPSPTPSSSSSSSTRRPRYGSNNEDDASPYGFRINGSPRLRPAASSSTSSLVNEPRKTQFCSTVLVHETFAASEYDRRCDPNTTCQKLTVPIAMKIKQELNEYKLTEMEVHVDSRQYTQFFL